MARMVASSPHTSRRNFECAAAQSVDRIARAAAMVAISKRRRSMPSRTAAFIRSQATATSGRVENAPA
jgi:hypothetical protein